nr:preprotein translocase subunit Sec61beta [Candidatus Sigynarchaeota archaeon]
MAKKQGKRAQRRSSKGMSPMGGAGLIRFYQDESSRVKVGPVATVLLAGALLTVVIWAWLRQRGVVPFP